MSTFPQSLRKEIVFITNNIEGYEQLISGFNPETEVHILDATRDGLTQIATTLESRSGIDAIHIVSHGAQASVNLGSTILTSQNLVERDADFAKIKNALNQDADIVLYGCNVAAGEGGEAFLRQMAEITEADISASSDFTGATIAGGNWVLEKYVGTIEASSVLMQAAPASFSGVLAAPADDDFTGYAADGATIPSPRTLGGFTYETDGSAKTYITDLGSLGLTVGSGKVIVLNPDDSRTGSYVEIHSSSLSDNFKLVSLMIESFSWGWSDSFTITGYDGGSGTGAVTSDTVNLAASDC